MWVLKMINTVFVLQGEPTLCEIAVVKMIDYDGNLIQRKLGESSAKLNVVRPINRILFIPFTVCKTKQSVCLPLCITICISVSQTEELVIPPVTDEAQEAFRDLTTVGLLQQELQ